MFGGPARGVRIHMGTFFKANWVLVNSCDTGIAKEACY